MTTNNQNPGILDFGEILRQRAAAQPADTAPSTMSREDMRQRLEEAKEFGNDEIKKFRELVKTFAAEVEKLVLFERVGESIEAMYVGYFLEQFILPLMANRKPFGMSDEAFKDVRRQMYKDLMDRYIE